MQQLFICFCVSDQLMSGWKVDLSKAECVPWNTTYNILV